MQQLFHVQTPPPDCSALKRVAKLACTMMYVDCELVALNTNPMCRAWILIFTEGGAVMSTRQVWLVFDVKGFSKTPLGENS